MPIYEFYCPSCDKLLSFFSRRVNTETLPQCPHCEGALSRQVSAFAMPREGDEPFDETKLANAMERFGGALDGDASDDPRKSAELVRQFSEASGLAFNKDMRDALKRLESGEDPDTVAADMESIVDSGADPFDGGATASSPSRRRSAPERDPTLYELTEHGHPCITEHGHPCITEHGHPCPCERTQTKTDKNVRSPLDRSPFYSPMAETDKHLRNLPHWQQNQVWCFITWRLGDSIPADKLKQWQEEKAAWLKFHPTPWDEATEEEYHRRFSRRMDEWLDQGSGSCLLKEPENARIVANALRHFDGERFALAAFVVMPNHVHVLFRPFAGNSIADIAKSWKNFSAREINKRMQAKGSIWQEEYWDRLVRSERHFYKCSQYIRENPVQAKLKDGYVLWLSEKQ